MGKNEQDARTARQKSDDALIRAADKVRELEAALNEAHTIHALEAGSMNRRFDKDQQTIAKLEAELVKARLQNRGTIEDLIETTNRKNERIAELEAALKTARQGYANQVEFEIIPNNYVSTNEEIIKTIDSALQKHTKTNAR